MTDRRYKLWLAFTAGQRPKKHYALLEEFGGSAHEVFLAAAGDDIPETGHGDAAMLSLMKAKATEDYIDRCLSYLEKQNISAVLFDDKNYPALLKEIYLPPPLLFVKGSLPDNIPLPLAVVGSRSCSPYGERVAKLLAGELAENGACIVSGMAYGIDRAAAEAALEMSRQDCPTVAVLGCGVDIVYPGENRDLYEKICSRGAVISEFQPGTKPEQYNFPQRNRIISGMSRGVVVAEAAIKSGTRITVDFALDQGRDVFAVPGRITDAFCAGTNQMIRGGMAKPVFCTEDILEEYGRELKAEEQAAAIDESGLSPDETLIARLLQAGERTADELCEMTGWDMAKINYILTGMELSGIIKQSPGRLYGL